VLPAAVRRLLRLVQLVQAFGDRVFREFLNIGIQRGVDAEAARQSALDAELFKEGLVHETGKVRARVGDRRIHLGAQLIARERRGHRRGDRRAERLRVDVAGRIHFAQHPIAADRECARGFANRPARRSINQ
jgi:hypothetical protein